MSWITIVPPEAEPISVEEARAHLEAQPYFESEVDPVDDAMIEGMIGAAREHCENFLGMSLSLRTLEIAPDSFPRSHRGGDVSIELPMGPVRDVLSILWGDESDEQLTDAAFVLDVYRRPNALTPAAGTIWPAVTAGTNRVKIRYVAGFGADSDLGDMPLPRAIRIAMLLIVGHLFENRSESNEGQVYAIPTNAETFLRPLRIRKGMA